MRRRGDGRAGHPCRVAWGGVAESGVRSQPSRRVQSLASELLDQRSYACSIFRMQGWLRGGWLVVLFVVLGCGEVKEPVEADAAVDADPCTDLDLDGFGSRCVRGADCDDRASSCTTSCLDSDQDGLPDCRDLCLDRDGDDYGQPLAASGVIGDGSVTVGECTVDGATACELDVPCAGDDRDDNNAECTDGIRPGVRLCDELNACDSDGNGLVDGTPITCIAADDRDVDEGQRLPCRETSQCLFGPWENPQCGTTGEGWHSPHGSCGVGQGTGFKRCRFVEVEIPDPCNLGGLGRADRPTARDRRTSN
jgi:hypothetical protein